MIANKHPIVRGSVAILASCVIGLFASCAKDEPKPHGMPSYNELPKLREQAMSGSGAAARRLALWHMKLPNRVDTYDFWTQIGAENGDSIAQYNLALLYLHSNTIPNSKARAVYWLKQSAAQGHERAEDELATVLVDRGAARVGP